MSSGMYVRVALYMHGINLDVDGITSYMKIEPTEVHLAGDLKSPGKPNSARYSKGIWSFVVDGYSNDLNAEVLRFMESVGSRKIGGVDFYGVDDGYIDVFVAVNVSSDRISDSISFSLSNEVIGLLFSTSLSVNVSVCHVVE